MARRTTVELVDDLDGTPATETVMFSLDGVGYEIDLSASNAAAMRAGMASWLSGARRVPARALRERGEEPAPTDPSRRGRRDPEQLRAIRRWARSHGYEVGDRGRIPQTVEDAYHRAH
ncbi:histone-like nucleoid-structuring protein Lsr2 [Brachybacterium hainanense]|uniref:Lsr2 family protein n=1 Tax=Brachybacterium hainanense TaxID=1541174 RepID=A0ABV6RA63_9MICO